jgi:hypothetical protein
MALWASMALPRVGAARPRGSRNLPASCNYLADRTGIHALRMDSRQSWGSSRLDGCARRNRLHPRRADGGQCAPVSSSGRRARCERRDAPGRDCACAALHGRRRGRGARDAARRDRGRQRTYPRWDSATREGLSLGRGRLVPVALVSHLNASYGDEAQSQLSVAANASIALKVRRSPVKARTKGMLAPFRTLFGC